MYSFKDVSSSIVKFGEDITTILNMWWASIVNGSSEEESNSHICTSACMYDKIRDK